MHLKSGEKNKRTIKIAPTNIYFELGYAIYQNTVRFISSSKENYGFIMESSELANTMKTQFDITWKLSKPFK